MIRVGDSLDDGVDGRRVIGLKPTPQCIRQQFLGEVLGEGIALAPQNALEFE